MCVSTDSDWENGQGYPHVMVFPALARLFVVTVAYFAFRRKKNNSCGQRSRGCNKENTDLSPLKNPIKFNYLLFDLIYLKTVPEYFS